jgi:hypothetical protein
MTMRFPFTASDDSVSIFLNGRMNTIAASAERFLELFEHLKLPEHDPVFIEGIIDRPRAMARLSCGALTVVGSTVFHNGIPTHSTLCMKLIAMLDAGFDATPWANFFNNLQKNPSEESKQALYGFLEKWQVPFTEDGCFIAFKYVRDDYKDAYTGKFDNTPGQTVKMLRIDVDSDPDQTCSYGLHVAASHYLNGYTPSDKIVACKVNPAHVVAIPSDYQHSKMRVCEYTVLCDVENPNGGGFEEIESQEVFTPNPIDTADVAVDEFADLYDDDGFDESGYDINGYDEYGYDRNGYDQDGLDDSGYDSGGYDSEGFDMSGRDEDGFDEMGFDENGFDADGYDRDGIHSSISGIVEMDEDDFAAGIAALKTSAADDGAGYVELIFARDGEVFTASLIEAGVATWGQRGFAERTGVPRSTVQGWLTTIAKAKS